MSNTGLTGKQGYVYNSADDTWYPIAGKANLSSNYDWTGVHEFQNTVSLLQGVNAKTGVNNFLNPADRDAKIPSPINGIVCFVRQNSSGSVINQIQYYYNGWVAYDAVLQSSIDTIKKKVDYVYSTTSYDVTSDTAGKTIYMDSSSNLTVNIPIYSSVPIENYTKIDFVRGGTGNVTFSAPVGVSLVSKNLNKSISSQYAVGTILKVNTNTWLIVGDLKA
jgi:hypothetical protein